MSQYRTIVNQRTGLTIVARAKLCTGFFSGLRGLMLSMSLAHREGLIFIRRRESRILSAMHTLGMRYSVAIVWLDREFSVVDLRIAPPWRAACVPCRAALYVIEAAPEILARVALGDQLAFDEVTD
jgi:uncharacterized membrane protein (UPF0127 family)